MMRWQRADSLPGSPINQSSFAIQKSLQDGSRLTVIRPLGVKRPTLDYDQILSGAKIVSHGGMDGFVCALFLTSNASAAPHQCAIGSLTGEFTLGITANPQQGYSLQWDFANHSAAILRSGVIVVVTIRKTNTSHPEVLKFQSSNMEYGWTIRNPSGEKLAPRNADSRACWITEEGEHFSMDLKICSFDRENLWLMSTAWACFILCAAGAASSTAA
jgi:hypothetical protein